MITIGTKSPTKENPYIIAEIGSNFSTLQDCIDSVKVAKTVGADCVKFQMLDFKSLYGQSIEHMPQTYSKKYEISIDWLPQLKEQCNDSCIDLMLSCFNPDMPRFVDPYVVAHKIASAELTDRDLIESVSSLGKPIFLSVGASDVGSIMSAMAVLKSAKVVLNYCVAAYPAKETDLFILDELKRFGAPVGLSDHSKDFNYLPRAACKLHGAVAIEKHLNAVNASSPDMPHSLTPGKFKVMVEYLRGQRQSMIGPCEEELPMIQRHKRRLVATKKIQKGQILSYGDNIGSFRLLSPSDNLITSFSRDIVDGQIARRDIMPGEAIGKFDF